MPIHRRPERTPKRKGRRLLKRLVIGVLVLWVLSLVPVASVRWWNPPQSAYMIAYRLEADRAPIYLWRDLRDLGPHLPMAAIAAEDQRFPSHHGFDLDQIRKALEEHESSGELRGASTITQQVARNLFLWSGRSWIRKGMEAYYAFWLEILVPKRRILELYLNIAEFGEGLYGAEAAALSIFNRPARDLTPWQAALLAATLPNPKKLSANPAGPYVADRASWILEQIDQLGGAAYLEKL